MPHETLGEPNRFENGGGGSEWPRVILGKRVEGRAERRVEVRVERGGEGRERWEGRGGRGEVKPGRP